MNSKYVQDVGINRGGNMKIIALLLCLGLCGIAYGEIETKVTCDVCGKETREGYYEYKGFQKGHRLAMRVEDVCLDCVEKAIEEIEGLHITREIWLEFNRAHQTGKKIKDKTLTGQGCIFEGLEYYPRYYFSEILASKKYRKEIIEWYKKRDK